MSDRKPLKGTAANVARVGAIGAVGGALALLGARDAREASGHLEFWLPGHLGRYLYNDSGCTPNGSGNGPGDPINVVFWRPQSNVYVSEGLNWMEDIGFSSGGGSTHWFRDHGYCIPMNAQNATGNELTTRYHARYLDVGTAPILLAPTHFEEVEITLSCDFGGIPGAGHAVPDEEDYYGWPWFYGFPYSGFLDARDTVMRAFQQQSNFNFTLQWWGNWESRRQCDNGEPWSDGWVAYLEAPPVPQYGGDCGRVMPCL